MRVATSHKLQNIHMVKVYKSPNPYVAASNTPITQQKDYYPTWCEYAAQKFEQIILSGSNGATIYTVPYNQVLFITSACLSTADSSGIVGTSADLLVTTSSGLNKSILSISPAAANQFVESVTNSFPMPLKIPSGGIIVVLGGVTDVRATIQGFLVPFVI